MNTLLPTIYHKTVRREKIFRLITMFFLLLSAVAVSGIVFLFPSYFVLIFSRDDVLRRLDVQQRAFERQDISSFEESIATINRRAATLQKSESLRHALAPLLARIADVDTVGIRLQSIDLRANTQGSFIFVLRGTATTRDAFLSYVKQLKGISVFSSVRSPISNILKESDVQFELEIAINKDSYFYVAQP